MKEIHNKGEADEHFIYRAAGLSMQDDKDYPKGSFVDSADIQVILRTELVSMTHLWGVACRNSSKT